MDKLGPPDIGHVDKEDLSNKARIEKVPTDSQKCKIMHRKQSNQ